MIDKFLVYQSICGAIGHPSDPIGNIKRRLEKDFGQPVSVSEKNGLNVSIGGTEINVPFRKIVCWRTVSLNVGKPCNDQTMSEIASGIQKFFPHQSIMVTQGGESDVSVLNSGDIRIQFDMEMEMINPKMLLSESSRDQDDPWSQLSSPHESQDSHFIKPSMY